MKQIETVRKITQDEKNQFVASMLLIESCIPKLRGAELNLTLDVLKKCRDVYKNIDNL